MPDFDYIAAWNALALPAFLALRDDPAHEGVLTSQLDAISASCYCFKQDNDCDVIVIEVGPLKGVVVSPPEEDDEDFEPLEPVDYDALAERTTDVARTVVENINQHVEKDPLFMAKAARAVYNFGHWRPGDAPESVKELYRSGECWIFSNLVDQALIRLLGLPKRGRAPKGWSITVHEGMLRLCHDSRDGWTWKEIGWATPENLEALRRVSKSGTVEETLQRAQRAIGLSDETSQPWLTVVETYDKSPEAKRLRGFNEGAPDGCRAVKETNVNFKPHPFTIGPKHLARSNGVLNPESAPCAHPGCTLSYHEHTSNRVLVIEVPCKAGEPIGPELNDQLKPWLSSLAPLMEAAKIEGFVFTAGA